MNCLLIHRCGRRLFPGKYKHNLVDVRSIIFLTVHIEDQRKPRSESYLNIHLIRRENIQCMIKILFLFSIVWMFQGFNYRPFLPSIAKNKVTPSWSFSKSSRSRLLNARWTNVLSSTLNTCICFCMINIIYYFFLIFF